MVGLILGVLGVKLGVPPKKVAFGRSNFRGTRFKIRGTPKKVALSRSNFRGIRWKIWVTQQATRAYDQFEKLSAYEKLRRMKNEGVWKMKAYEQ